MNNGMAGHTLNQKITFGVVEIILVLLWRKVKPQIGRFLLWLKNVSNLGEMTCTYRASYYYSSFDLVKLNGKAASGSFPYDRSQSKADVYNAFTAFIEKQIAEQNNWNHSMITTWKCQLTWFHLWQQIKIDSRYCKISIKIMWTK